ncbi:MAG: exodeoxyribonuclease I [Lysobacterales bacterium]
MPTATPTLLWYDFETTGADPSRDRPQQFAAIRTNLELAPIAEPAVLTCALAGDVLPHPEASLLTGIVPQDTTRDGLIEAEFAEAVNALLVEPGTCSVGYNSIRFDDNINRYLFYRNFFDPYEHAWKNGNSRWDILDLARAFHALRPDGIEWPNREDGMPSFRLPDLAAANGIEHDHAHDALSDVRATIAFARLLRERQPRLYDWHFALRDKKRVAQVLGPALAAQQPLLHVSGRYPAERGCLAMVVPITEHPLRSETLIVADLGVDPDEWTGLDAEELDERLYTAREDLPDGVERPPLKEIHGNRSPFIAPVETLRGVDLHRIGLTPDRCLANLGRIRTRDGLAERVRRAFAAAASRQVSRADPELKLYDGFPSEADRRRIGKVRSTPPARLGHTQFGFDDSRYPELLFRYRARNWPATLDAGERRRWRAFVRDKLTRDTETTTLTLERYSEEIARLRAATPPGPRQALLDRLEAWGERIRGEIGD